MQNNPATTEKTTSQSSSTEQVMHRFSEEKGSVSAMKVLIILVIVGVIGIGSGFALSQVATGSAKAGGLALPQVSSVQSGKTYGVTDTKSFPDTAEGTLQNGGIDGEGQYHLVRPGGDSQNVYMTSSTVDLSQFLGKKIKVWGATQTAQHAGWLMDVGKVEVE